MLSPTPRPAAATGTRRWAGSVTRTPARGGSRWVAVAAGDECEPPDHAQNDETALSVDVGYYLDFDVDAATGRPRGCPSFESKANGGKLRVGGQHFLVNCISYASLLVYCVVRTTSGKAAMWWTARRTATRPRASPCTRLWRSSLTTRRPGSRS